MLCKIVINRYQPGLYGWEIWNKSRPLARGMGVRSVDDCIGAALPGLPGDSSQVELQYCAMHLGTFPVKQLVERTTQWVAGIVSRHKALTAGR